jgi:thiamine-phosphate pyrophosphorylase
VSRPGKDLRSPILCYVTDRRSLASRSAGDQCDILLERIAAAASAGVDWIQIREKDLTGKEISSLTRQAVAHTKQTKQSGAQRTQILVNDRLDVALAEHAGGVHLGDHSLRVQEVCKGLRSNPGRSVPEKFLVGVSCHCIDDAASAARAGADYIFFGPVFATPSKAAFGAPQGLERLAEVCSAVSVPVLAIGGLTRENASACLAAGAAGIAAIRLFQETAGLQSLVQILHGRS